MTVITPHAYLAPSNSPDDEQKLAFIVNHLLAAPAGTEFPVQLAVQFVDPFGDVEMDGVIAGRVATVIKLVNGTAIAVFSTGERVALTSL